MLDVNERKRSSDRLIECDQGSCGGRNRSRRRHSAAQVHSCSSFLSNAPLLVKPKGLHNQESFGNALLHDCFKCWCRCDKRCGKGKHR
ncbi:hypothetical protein GE061_009614 [Apolygus lucorum]|uniref:Uncharacterized protein n=1 Tax=Apolygus lucorum TaxID=248454 RepID=A0A8S9Y0Q2_APOLU|nr:hypothetical protein GE061_009614 [Apolygus lucorum]